jgi:rare lipoprotein A
MRRRSLSFAFLALALVSCARKPRAPRPRAAPPGATETGVASWYGHPYHGRRAADGSVYDMEQLTAAHRTLPFGARVRVTRLDNGKRVEVRITDRGPFVDGRIIDLSRAAARAIDLIGPGVARVRLVVLSSPDAREGEPAYAVQAGVFRDRARAEDLRRRLGPLGEPVVLVPRDGGDTLWRVLVGRKATLEDAESLAARLRARSQDAMVVRLDASGRPRQDD